MPLFTVYFRVHREGTPFSVAAAALVTIPAVEADDAYAAADIATAQLRAVLLPGFELNVSGAHPYSPDAPVFVRGRREDVTE